MQVISAPEKPAEAVSDAGIRRQVSCRPAPVALTVWILFCAFCNCAGWVLSALHQLNEVGYAVAFVIGAVSFWIFRRQIFPAVGPGFRIGKFKGRFKRAIPMAFLILAGMSFIGGMLYAPNNYDALAYRIPRVLHWLAEGKWHWIHTQFNRVNTRAPGFEWVAAPLIAFTRTDRFLFLINVCSFLLMPSLVFSVFRRLGVRARVAWHWMWLLPTGYCFLLQAGSIGNDLFGTMLALAAVDYALRAVEAQRVEYVWISVVAAGLMTASKASNLPLLLPWLVAIFPALNLIRRRILGTAVMAVLAGLCSLLPQMVLNIKYCGEWSGVHAENGQFMEHHDAVHVANNAALLLVQNFAPPVFPWVNAWDAQVRRTMPESLRTKLEESFEPAGAHWALSELQSEEHAGIGFGVSALLLISLGAGLVWSKGKAASLNSAGGGSNGRLDRLKVAVAAGAWIALLVFMAKSGMSTVGRLIAPYYALCIPGLLWAGGVNSLVRACWWKWAAIVVFALAAVPSILSPSRPLWPANTILGHTSGGGKLADRARTVYAVYGQRADGFAAVRKLLPPDMRTLGLVTYDDPETSLWKPFGSRRIEHVTRNDTAADLQRKGIEYVLVNPERVKMLFDETMEEWVRGMHAQVQERIALPLRAGTGPSEWYLIKL